MNITWTVLEQEYKIFIEKKSEKHRFFNLANLRIKNLKSGSVFDIAIYDTNGTLVAKYENQTNNTLTLENSIQQGIYLVSFRSEHQKMNTKMNAAAARFRAIKSTPVRYFMVFNKRINSYFTISVWK